ncbi:MAG TPA: SsrA-binding protein SmpB [Candidatus Paceibacterota bacterium]
MNLIEHGKARFDYEILESFEAGIELFGHEVKSLRLRRGKLEGSHVIVRGGEVYLVGMSLPSYQAGNTPQGYDPERTRKLLLTKTEIGTLAGYEGKKGLTLVPISVYSKGRTLKVQVAVARGKKKYDKRASIKKRDQKREIERTLKNA